jgi:hypothetical protein
MFKLEFKTDNAAFGESFPTECSDECARILSAISQRLRQGDVRGRCIDYNGNCVGTWELTDD